jgi:hypothetical protein
MSSFAVSVLGLPDPVFAISAQLEAEKYVGGERRRRPTTAY